MSFFGTLGVGITGLLAQSNKLDIISDNIANVNTVGYKESVASFSTLLVNDATAANYTALGVDSQRVQRISRQGLLQTSQSPTDLAISGNGFFVVADQATGGLVRYTRAGSFLQDRDGNFRNAAGLFLQAWQLDAQGNPIMGALQTLNIQQLNGAATATSTISIGANLDANEIIFPGAGATADLDPLDLLNVNNTATDLIVPNGVNQIARGDVFNITTGSGLNYNYTYGGFSIGRDVSDPTAAGNGDNGVSVLTSPLALVNPFQSVGSGSGDVIVTVPSTVGLSTGDVVTFNGSTAVGGITAAELTGSFIITVLSPTTFRITTAGSDPAVGGTAGGGPAVVAITRPYTGAIFDATAANISFFGSTGTSNIDPSALSFTITTATSGTVTFSYVSGTPNTQLGQFNNLNNLALAIDDVIGLTARVVNGRLYVGAEDANAAVTFANTQPNGTAGPPVLHGLDWVSELGLSNIGSDTNRFSTLNNLAAVINSSTGLRATVANPLGDASVDIYVNDPTDTITFSDRPIPASIPLAPNAYTTTLASNTVTINATIPGLQVGDIINLSGLAPGVYNGIPHTALNGNFYVQAVAAGTISIVVNVPPASVTAGAFGLGGELIRPPSNNGSLLGQLGITPSLNGAPFPATNPVPTTGALGPSYDPTGASVPAPVTLGLNAYTTTAGSQAVTLAATVPGLQVGDTITLSGLAAGTYNGIPHTDLNSTFTVQAIGAGTITITVATNPALITGGTFGAGAEVLSVVNTRTIASGEIAAQFSRSVTVFDAEGNTHDLNIGFIKTGINEWAVEVYAVPASDVVTANPDGQLAVGTLLFNGDGTLNSISPALTAPLAINWSNGAAASSITIDWGTAGPIFGTPGATLFGSNDGMTQLAGRYNTVFVDQNGASVGELVGITVDQNGDVITTYTNSNNQRLYRIPLALFIAPDSLQQVSNNLFLETADSGAALLTSAGTNGAGDIFASQLESANTDLSSQLTDMIIAQRSYQSNSRLISISDELLQDLKQMGA